MKVLFFLANVLLCHTFRTLNSGIFLSKKSLGKKKYINKVVAGNPNIKTAPGNYLQVYFGAV